MLHKFRNSVEFNEPHWQSEKWLPIAKAFWIYNLYVGMKVGIYTVSNANVYKQFALWLSNSFSSLCVSVLLYWSKIWKSNTLSCFISVLTAKNPSDCANWELQALILSCVEEIMWKKKYCEISITPETTFTQVHKFRCERLQSGWTYVSSYWVMHSLPLNPLIPAQPVKTVIFVNIINIYINFF